ncbi:MAG: flagellar motor switch protein FliN [Planctomycetes bacterium]|nr:flagellar motor switch protein FliN [Planctomycetota bacterium]
MAEQEKPGKGDEISQGDIDKLLEQAGLGGAGGKPAAAAKGQDEIDQLLQQSAPGGPAGGIAASGGARSFQLDRFEETELDDEGKLEILMDVNLDVRVVLGRSRMAIEDIIRLKPGSVVELDKLAGDPLDVLVNNRLVARGEVLVLNDNFCIRVTEILSPEARAEPGGRA